jgi:hypothetical protein
MPGLPPRRRRAAVALLLATAFSLAAIVASAHGTKAASPSWRCPTTKPKPTPASSRRGLALPPYAPASPFNTPISPTAQVMANSPFLVQGLVQAASEASFVVAFKRWTVSVFYADSSTPRKRIPLTEWWARTHISGKVPLPDGAVPDPSDDGHMVVVDKAGDCEYDFYATHRGDNGSWSAGWVNSIRLSSKGVYPHGGSARGSGFGLLAGLIFPAELRRGEIRHALIFSYPFTKSGGPVPPATESDGRTVADAAIPEGARLRLDPSLDLRALQLTPYERTIAKALQVYGMYLADTGGGVSLYAVNPLSYSGSPFQGVFPDETYVSLGGIPLDRFQVLVPQR